MLSAHGDLACRYGGEELTVVLPDASLEDARARLEHIRETIMVMPIHYREGELPGVTVSVGVAAASAETDASVLLSRADAALYQAKAKGRNQLVVAATDSASAGGPCKDAPIGASLSAE